jgi:hypothetical protein
MTDLPSYLACLAIGFLLGVGVWQVTNIIRDTRRLGQERRKAERRARTGGSGRER